MKTLIVHLFNNQLVMNTMKVKDSVDSKRDMSLLESSVKVPSKFSDMLYNTCYYQVRPSCIVKYSYSEFVSHKRNDIIEQLNSGKNHTYNGEMSHNSKKNLRKKLEIWFDGLVVHNALEKAHMSNNFRKMVFVTLTLSATQWHSDLDVKKLILKPFLRIMRRDFGCENYIWKAESQENGNIHFHLVFDRFIEKEKLQEVWNGCQDALGYIDEFEKKFDHRNPPSTHIEAVKDRSGAMKYFEKYIEKDEGYRLIDGACWKGSRSVMSLSFFEVVSDSGIDLRVESMAEKKDIEITGAERYMVIKCEKSRVNQILGYENSKSRLYYYSCLDQFLFTVTGFTDWVTYYELHNPNTITPVVVPIIREEKLKKKAEQLKIFEDLELEKLIKKNYLKSKTARL